MNETLLYRYTKLYLETNFRDFNSMSTYTNEMNWYKDALSEEGLSKCEEFREYILEEYPDGIGWEGLLREAREYLAK